MGVRVEGADGPVLGLRCWGSTAEDCGVRACVRAHARVYTTAPVLLGDLEGSRALSPLQRVWRAGVGTILSSGNGASWRCPLRGAPERLGEPELGRGTEQPISHRTVTLPMRTPQLRGPYAVGSLPGHPVPERRRGPAGAGSTHLPPPVLQPLHAGLRRGAAGAGGSRAPQPPGATHLPAGARAAPRRRALRHHRLGLAAGGR